MNKGIHTIEGGYGGDAVLAEWVIRKRAELLDSRSAAEWQVGAFLSARGKRFEFQSPWIFPSGKVYFADFYLPEDKLVIECDGGYHYGKERMAIDEERDREFAGLGITTVRLDNSDVRISVLRDLFNGICGRKTRSKRRRIAIVTRPGA